MGVLKLKYNSNNRNILKLKYNSNNRNVLKLKYIPTDMFAVRYFNEQPFIVPEGTSFAKSDGVDFSSLNLELKKDGYYPNLFNGCKDCKIDTEKLKLNKISKDITNIFAYNNNNEIIGELPTFYDNQYYFTAWKLEKMTDEYVFELANKISNMKFINDYFKGDYFFYFFSDKTNFQIYSYKNLNISKTNVFPILDLSKWNISNSSANYLFDNTNVYRLKMFVPKKVINYISLNYNPFYAEIVENFDFSKFKSFGSGNSIIFSIFYGKNLGFFPSNTDFNFRGCKNWGDSDYLTHLENTQGKIFDRTTPKESKQSLIYTLIEHSFDRKTAGYSTFTIYLHNNTKSLLTSEEIAQITAKGFTIA